MDGTTDPVRDDAACPEVVDTDTRTSFDDVFNGYRLFLGRHPQSVQELTTATDCSIPEFLSHYLMRGEFLSGVVERLNGTTLLPHVTLAPTPDDALERWARTRLPLSPTVRSLLSTSRSWRFWLLTILRDPAFRACLPATVAGWMEQSGLNGRLAAVELAPTRQLIGEVSYNGAGAVLGWCANASDFSERVVLELSLGGRFVGAVRCERFVPGLAERIGGTGQHGFLFEVPTSFGDLATRGAMLRICDMQSKAPFGSEIYVKDNLPAALDELGQILSAIGAVKDILASLEQQIPHTVRNISPPLSAYGSLKPRGLLACHRPDMGGTLGTASGTTVAAGVNVILFDPAPEPERLRRLLASLDRQSHPHWLLTVLAAEAALDDETRTLLRPLAAQGRVLFTAAGDLPRAIAGHPALKDTHGHLAVGRAGTLRPDALARFLAALERGPVAYSDHDVEIDARNGQEAEVIPVFKPAFDPVMLLAYDYAGPMVMVAPDALLKAFAIADGVPPASLHDLLLRLGDCVPAAAVQHVPAMLYSLRHSLDFRGPGGVPRLLTGETDAVEAWVRRRGMTARVHRERLVSNLGVEGPGQALVEPCVVDLHLAAHPAVSVIVPTRNSPALLRNCLESLLRVRQAYPGPLQILVIDHENEDPESVGLIAAMRAQRGVDVLAYRGPFNWALSNNLAAAKASGDVLVFLNDDTMSTDHRWLNRAVATLALPDVAVVGARLLYGDGSIQHAGVVTSTEQGAVHEAIGTRGDDGGYLGRNLVLRSAAAVTGACLITRRTVFEAVGGFDAGWPVNWNDITYCLAVRKAGLRVVYDPQVCLYHHESKTRGYLLGQRAQDVHRNDLRKLREEWGSHLDDPFHNPSFSRTALPFTRIML